MTFELLINSIDRTDNIIIDSISKQDNINEQVDTLKFRILKYGDHGFTPEKNQEVEFNIDGVKEFAGVITEITQSIQSGSIVQYDITCSDYSQHLNRKLVLERYTDETVYNIIHDIITKYADDFTIANVSCDIRLKGITFNRVPVSAVIDKLAEVVSYSWYVDYDKDIHFFKRNTNIAPFSITDTNGGYIQNTLTISDDLSQIRNVVIIRGGDQRGDIREEEYVADGEQLVFNTNNKFAEKPRVFVDGSEIEAGSVGVDYLTAEEDADCFWNFAEKYVRFKEETQPAVGEVVKFSGIPLYPILVKALEPNSIAKYGTYEFFKEDKSIVSKQEALRYALAQLEAYKNGIIEGTFRTDIPGLKSGQLITIDSDLLGINETFLIQSVIFKAVGKNKGDWSVKLATFRTVGIIQVLQDLIRYREIREFDPDNLLTLVQFSDEFTMIDSLQAGDEWTITSPPYMWMPEDPDDDAQCILDNPTKTPMLWNKFTWSA